MQPKVLMAAGGLAAAAIVAVSAVVLLGGSSQQVAPILPPRAPVGTPGPGPASPGPGPSTPVAARPPRPVDPPREPTAAVEPPAADDEALAGEALRARVREIVARGEGAADGRAEQAAAADLVALLEAVSARGDAAREEARALLAPGERPGVHEVGVRLLGKLGGPAALERLADVTLDAAFAPEVRLLALRTLSQLDGAFAQGVIGDVVQATGQDLGLRGFAMEQLAPASASALEDVARDAADDPRARLYALQQLYRLDRPRAEAVHRDLVGDPAVGPHLGQIELPN